MHKSTNYTFTDFTLVGEKVIFSTDVKAITVSIDDLDAFIKDLLPVDSLPSNQSVNVINIPGVELSIFGEIATGLMTSFREVQGAKGNDEQFLNQAIKRSRAKIDISRTMTGIAKLALDVNKAKRGQK